MSVPLRNHRAEGAAQARQVIGHCARYVLPVALLGAGRSASRAHLSDECGRKGRRAAFVVDRLRETQTLAPVYSPWPTDRPAYRLEGAPVP